MLAISALGFIAAVVVRSAYVSFGSDAVAPMGAHRRLESATEQTCGIAVQGSVETAARQDASESKATPLMIGSLRR
jgi:hypothetical protein